MSRHRRAVGRALAVLVAVGAALATGVPGAAAAGPAVDRVIVVGVPGLTWDDVDADRTPQLADLARHSSVGALSVRAARSTTCVLDGCLSREHAAALRAGLLACALTLAVGAAANDSGVAVPAAAAALLVPLLIWLAASEDPDARTAREADATLSGRVRGARRVTVGSRGSTVWNA